VSKPQISFKDKAPVDEKAQHTWSYVSILKRLATQPLDVPWGFETTSRITQFYSLNRYGINRPRTATAIKMNSTEI
jgi:hypothetical protein